MTVCSWGPGKTMTSTGRGWRKPLLSASHESTLFSAPKEAVLTILGAAGYWLLGYSLLLLVNRVREYFNGVTKTNNVIRHPTAATERKKSYFCHGEINQQDERNVGARKRLEYRFWFTVAHATSSCNKFMQQAHAQELDCLYHMLSSLLFHVMMGRSHLCLDDMPSTL